MNFDFNYDSDTWIQFLQDNWLILLIALVVLLLVIGIVRTVVKWLIVAIIIIAVIVYSGITLDDVKSLGDKVTDSATLDDLKTKVSDGVSGISDSVKQEAIKAMAGEMKDATYKTESDGTFTITTKNLELNGKPGDDEVKVSFRGTSLGTWKIDDTIQKLIDQAKSNSGKTS